MRPEAFGDDPTIWTELEYHAALARHRTLRRQRRLKESRALLQRIRLAVIAELKRDEAFVSVLSSFPSRDRRESPRLAAV